MRNPNLEKVIGRIIGKSKKEESEIEKAKENKEKEFTTESATSSSTSKIYLKAFPLRSLDDLEKIKNEVKSGNILIIRVGPLACLLYTSPSPRDLSTSRMPSSA